MAKGRSIIGTIPQSKYVPRQMNGPIINAYAAAQEAESTEAQAITDYLHDLTLNNEQETELENIGRLIGFPRPIVPEGFNSSDIFLFTVPPVEINPEIGFSDLTGPGGMLVSTDDDPQGTKIDLGLYRKVLKVIARIKRYGVTIKNIDDIVSEFSTDYTISWEDDHDIRVFFNTSIGYKNLWVLTQVFGRVCTQPQVNFEYTGGSI